MKEGLGERHSAPSDKFYDQQAEKDKETLSKTGMGFFIRASREMPASITAQGALIAKYCKESDMSDPLLLSKYLLLDDIKVAKIAEIGAKVHEHAGNGPALITEYEAYGIIRSDFAYADIFMSNNIEKLDFITHELYDDVQKRNYNEDRYFTRALNVKYERRMHAAKKDFKEHVSRFWFRKQKNNTPSR